MERAENETYELVTVDGIPAAFTHARLDRDSVPKGLHCYDVRHDDECQGTAVQIEPKVMVNHWGTILTKQEIPLTEDGYTLDDDLNYIGMDIALNEFECMDESQLEDLIRQAAPDIQMNQ